jgi:hypothetical protein
MKYQRAVASIVLPPLPLPRASKGNPPTAKSFRFAEVFDGATKQPADWQHQPRTTVEAAMATKLSQYRAKRDFTKTAEPSGKLEVTPSKVDRFVIQKHAATRLH